MEKQCLSLTKTCHCHFYQELSSSGHFPISPYNCTPLSNSDFSCSFISSTTVESNEPNNLSADWTGDHFVPNDIYASPQNIHSDRSNTASISMPWTHSVGSNCLLNSADTDSKKNFPLNKGAKKRHAKSNYKHVPHREKPVHLVARRNARERKRVQAVNSAFVRLRKCVPVENRNKRLSKVKTLHKAIEYIAGLEQLLQENESQGTESDNATHQHPTLLMASAVIDRNSSGFGEPSLSGGPSYMNSETVAGLYAPNSLMISRGGANCKLSYSKDTF